MERSSKRQQTQAANIDVITGEVVQVWGADTLISTLSALSSSLWWAGGHDSLADSGLMAAG